LIDAKSPNTNKFALTTQQRVLVLIVLFMLALIPRGIPNPVMTTDEQAFWVNRTANFLAGLREGDLAETAQSFHPGVMTNWIGSTGIILSDIINGPNARAENFQAYLAALRFPFALVNALTIIFAYFMLRRLFDERLAIIACFLWALDPFLVAHGGIAHVDAITTSFMVTSFIAGLIAFQFDEPDNIARPTRWRWLIISAVFGAFGGVTKFTTLGVAGILGLCLLYQHRTRWRQWFRLAVAPMIVWTLIAVIVWFGVFPATWVNMNRVIARLDQGLELALNAHKPGNFYLGEPLEDPGLSFYVVATLFRITPWVMLGLVVALIAALRGAARKWHLPLVSMVIFIVVFGLVMTLQPKKLDRYVLQYFPLLNIIATFGLLWLWDWLQARLPVLRPTGVRLVEYGLAVLIPVLTIIGYHPYEMSYYNPVMGGSAGALNTLLVGWGEGIDQAMALMGDEVKRCDESIMTFYFEIAQRYTDCQTNVHPMQDNPQGINDEKYLMFYVSQLQRGLYPRLIASAEGVEPAYVVRLHGIDYALVYDTADLTYESVPEDTFQDLTIFRNSEHNDDVVRLKRWDLMSDVHVPRCGGVTVESWWQADNAITDEYLLSLVAVNEGGEGVTRVEEALGNVNTKVWQPERAYHDIRTLTIPCNMEPGEYPLMFIIRERSLYWPLHAEQPDGAPLDDLVYLTTLFVE
jgi:hypothetical protein